MKNLTSILLSCHLAFLPVLFPISSFHRVSSFSTHETAVSNNEKRVSSTNLFSIQRNTDKNVVFYDADLLPDQTLNPEHPVKIYWVRNTEGGKVKDLSFLQRKMAYGLDIKKAVSNNTVYEAKIAAYAKRPIKITYNAANQPVALITINGKWQQLHHIYLNIEDASKLIPKVSYIQIFGYDQQTGQEVNEKIIP